MELTQNNLQAQKMELTQNNLQARAFIFNQTIQFLTDHHLL